MHASASLEITRILDDSTKCIRQHVRAALQKKISPDKFGQNEIVQAAIGMVHLFHADSLEVVDFGSSSSSFLTALSLFLLSSSSAKAFLTSSEAASTTYYWRHRHLCASVVQDRLGVRKVDLTYRLPL